MIASQPARPTWSLLSAPLLPPAIGLMIGVVLDDRIHLPILLSISALLAGSVLAHYAAHRPPIVIAGILLAAAGTGGLLHGGRVRFLPRDSIAGHLTDDPQLVRLFGEVASAPRLLTPDDSSLFAAWQHRGERTTFLLDTLAVEGTIGNVPVSGRVRVNVYETVLDLREGEEVEVFGWLSKLRGPQNPGSFDWATYYHRQGIVASLRTDHRQCVRRLHQTSAPPAVGWLERFRAKVRGWLVDDLATGDEEGASLLAAMILGQRSQLDRQINDMFINSGCIHFLAVSGTHVLMLMAAVWMAGRMLRVSRRWSAWGVLVLLLLYALVTEPRPPILRATIVGMLYCLSILLLRGHASLNWLSAAAIILLVVDPACVFDVGFQLSFAAVLGVSHLAPSLLTAGRNLRRASFVAPIPFFPMPSPRPLREDLSPSLRFQQLIRLALARLGRAIAVTLAVSFGAWLAGLPIGLFHFQRMQPWGAVNSVAVLPLITLVTVLGAAKVVVAVVSPTLSVALGSVIHIANEGLLELIQILAKLPGASLFGPSPPFWWIIGFYATLVGFIAIFPPAWNAESAMAWTTSPPPRNRWKRMGVGAAVGWLLFGTLAVYGPRRGSGCLEINALAVGAGSATVIELPDGQAMLFDAGSSTYPDAGRNTVLPFLRERRIHRLSTVFVSHANLDHYNALPDILAEIPADRIIFTPYFQRDATPNSPPRRWLDWLEQRDIPWAVRTSGASEVRADVTFDFHWPPKDLEADCPANDTSLVLNLRFGGQSILLIGDVETRAQRALLDDPNLRADVLFLPHHGGMSQVLDRFVRKVGASVLVRSAREPLSETMSGLPEIAAGTPLLNTADRGAISLRIHSNGSRSVATPCATGEAQKVWSLNNGP